MIELRHISKSFKEHKVLEDISIDIKNNYCTALIGKNGAGKSTLIDIIVGNNHYDSGQIADKSNLLNRHKMGILFQKTEFPKYIKVCELLHLYQSFYQTFISFHQFKEITQFSDRQMNQFACNLSGGQQRILDFALALVGKPELLILDEPTSAMDVEMRQHFWNVIDKLKMNNTTILYTSHYIEEVERMADQVMMLDKGKIQLDDSPENIKRNQSYSVIRLPCKYQELINQLKHKYEIELIKNRYEIKTTDVSDVLQLLKQYHVNFNKIEILKKSLLEVMFSNDLSKGGNYQ